MHGSRDPNLTAQLPRTSIPAQVRSLVWGTRLRRTPHVPSVGSHGHIHTTRVGKKPSVLNLTPGMEGNEEERKTTRARDQGRPNGLFQGCMDAIKTGHRVGQTLRTAMLTAGLLTDRRCYAELLAQFYVCTVALEDRLAGLKGTGSAAKLAASIPGVGFKAGYEADLRHLLGDRAIGTELEENWRTKVASLTTGTAARYISRIEIADDEELIAAVFILWGPLMIGGGAAIRPRVQKAFGEGATNVFDSVIGPGRSELRRAFINAFDSVLDVGNASATGFDSVYTARYTRILAATAEFMTLNNELMLSVKQSPWWSRYISAGCAFAVAVIGYVGLQHN